MSKNSNIIKKKVIHLYNIRFSEYEIAKELSISKLQ